jgi:hypothetical protein
MKHVALTSISIYPRDRERSVTIAAGEVVDFDDLDLPADVVADVVAKHFAPAPLAPARASGNVAAPAAPPKNEESSR